MPATQIANPAGAFNPPYGDTYSALIEEFVAGASITQGQIVSLSTTGTLLVGTVVLAPKAIGVALDTVVTGQICRVQTKGLSLVNVIDTPGGSAGDIVSPIAAGAVGAASTTIGSNIGFLPAAISAAAAGLLYIEKM